MWTVAMKKKKKNFCWIRTNARTGQVPRAYRPSTTRVPDLKKNKKKLVRRRCVPMEYHTRTGTRYVPGTGTLQKMEYPCIIASNQCLHGYNNT
jgi:hypothetical protein